MFCFPFYFIKAIYYLWNGDYLNIKAAVHFIDYIVVCFLVRLAYFFQVCERRKIADYSGGNHYLILLLDCEKPNRSILNKDFLDEVGVQAKEDELGYLNLEEGDHLENRSASVFDLQIPKFIKLYFSFSLLSFFSVGNMLTQMKPFVMTYLTSILMRKTLMR